MKEELRRYIECRACNGEGKAIYEGMYGGDYLGTCRTCDGTGKVEWKEKTAENRIEYANTLLEENAIVPRDLLNTLLINRYDIPAEVIKELRECYFRKEEV